MLTNAADDGAEGTLHLPVDSIVEHVEKDDSLIPHENVLIAQQLDQDLFDELE